MNIKQQYIVLYASDGKTPVGFVKLTHQGDQALVQAQVNLRTEAEATLVLDDGRSVIRLPMQRQRTGLLASGRVSIGGGRIVAGVCAPRGLLALGQSMSPKAYWPAFEAICRTGSGMRAGGEVVPASTAHVMSDDGQGAPTQTPMPARPESSIPWTNIQQPQQTAPAGMGKNANQGASMAESNMQQPQQAAPMDENMQQTAPSGTEENANQGATMPWSNMQQPQQTAPMDENMQQTAPAGTEENANQGATMPWSNMQQPLQAAPMDENMQQTAPSGTEENVNQGASMAGPNMQQPQQAAPMDENMQQTAPSGTEENANQGATMPWSNMQQPQQTAPMDENMQQTAPSGTEENVNQGASAVPETSYGDNWTKYGTGEMKQEKTMPRQKRVPMLSMRSRLRENQQGNANDMENQNAMSDEQNMSYEGMQEDEDNVSQQEIRLAVMGPYAQLWRWRRVASRGTEGYLLGHAIQDGEVVAVAVAVPGSYAPFPPPNLQGFHAYRDGHWILAQDAKTGEIVDI